MSKQQKKALRRAHKLGERAWAAAEAGELYLACKEMRRALGERQDNPVLWNDYALILEMTGEPKEAEKALRNAILIAPGYAEGYANLAALVARGGRAVEAERLQRRAVELAPERPDLREQLELYAAVRPEPEATDEASWAGRSDDEAAGMLALDSYDWPAIEEALTEQGACVLPALLAAGECQTLIGLFDQDDFFEKTVHLAGDAGSQGAYRFFRRPFPRAIEQLRGEVYPRLAGLANRWNAWLKRKERWPLSHQRMLAQCAEERQTRPTPILLRYVAPAVNELHRDISGRFYFPIQLTVTLSRRASEQAPGFEGAEFVLADTGRGAKGQRLEFPTGEGDGVLFCTGERLVRFGSGWALQSVGHGMALLTSGERFALGIPFHDYL